MDSAVKTLFLLLSVYICLQVECAKLPASITPCKRNNPELNKCVVTEVRKYFKEFIKGVPELGIPNLSPLTITDELSFNSGKNGVSIKIKGATIDVTRGLKISSFKVDIPNKKITLDVKNNATISGNYESKGEFLMLPMNGKGPIKIFIDSLRLKSNLDWILIKGKDNQDHIKITKSTSQYSVKDIKVNIRGLESKEMDKEMMTLFDDNWRLVEEELAPKLMKDFNDELTKLGNKYFENFSYNELFPL